MCGATVGEGVVAVNCAQTEKRRKIGAATDRLLHALDTSSQKTVCNRYRRVKRRYPRPPAVGLRSLSGSTDRESQRISRGSRSGRSAESFLPIRLYGIVDPHLNRACVKAIVVVVAAAVLAAVAYVGYESLSCAAGPRIQENATA